MNKTSNLQDFSDRINQTIKESSSVILDAQNLNNEINQAIKIITDCFRKGNKVIIFGNGGSAADAQHFAAEFVGRYLKERQSLPAIALTTDTSIITAIGNDYGFEYVFSRQCESIVNENDVVIAISTSGKSKNIVNGVITSKKRGAFTIGLTGEGGRDLGKIIDLLLVVPSKSTPRIQEVHRIIMHVISELVEENFCQ